MTLPPTSLASTSRQVAQQRRKEVLPGIVHELDKRGRLLAIEVHKASRTLGRGALANH